MTQLVAATCIYLLSWKHLEAEKLQHHRAVDGAVALGVPEFAATVILATWSDFTATFDLAT